MCSKQVKVKIKRLMLGAAAAFALAAVLRSTRRR